MPLSQAALWTPLAVLKLPIWTHHGPAPLSTLKLHCLELGYIPQASGLSRTFPGGQAAHLQEQNEEKKNKKIREKKEYAEKCGKI